jgi:hypothetical protein
MAWDYIEGQRAAAQTGHVFIDTTQTDVSCFEGCAVRELLLTATTHDVDFVTTLAAARGVKRD